MEPGSDTAYSETKGEVRIVKDMVAATISSTISTYIGYPLDTVKVRLQLTEDRISAVSLHFINLIS